MPLLDFLYQDEKRLASLRDQLGTSTVTETLDALRGGGYIRKDVRTLVSGLIEITGDLFLVDQALIEFAGGVARDLPLEEGTEEPDDFEDEDEFDQDDEDLYDEDEFDYDDEDEDFESDPSGPNPLAMLFAQLDMPSIFVLRTERGDLVCGPISDEFLTERAAFAYVRQQALPLARVTLVAIKEPQPGGSDEVPQGIARAVAPLVRSVFEPMLPANASRVIPIVMYREIGRTEVNDRIQ